MPTDREYLDLQYAKIRSQNQIAQAEINARLRLAAEARAAATRVRNVPVVQSGSYHTIANREYPLAKDEKGEVIYDEHGQAQVDRSQKPVSYHGTQIHELRGNIRALNTFVDPKIGFYQPPSPAWQAQSAILAENEALELHGKLMNNEALPGLGNVKQKLQAEWQAINGQRGQMRPDQYGQLASQWADKYRSSGIEQHLVPKATAIDKFKSRVAAELPGGGYIVEQPDGKYVEFGGSGGGESGLSGSRSQYLRDPKGFEETRNRLEKNSDTPVSVQKVIDTRAMEYDEFNKSTEKAEMSPKDRVAADAREQAGGNMEETRAAQLARMTAGIASAQPPVAPGAPPSLPPPPPEIRDTVSPHLLESLTGRKFGPLINPEALERQSRNLDLLYGKYPGEGQRIPPRVIRGHSSGNLEGINPARLPSPPDAATPSEKLSYIDASLEALRSQYKDAKEMPENAKFLAEVYSQARREFAEQEVNPTAGLPLITTKAGYDALPSGAVFVAPTGVKKRKP